jgi:hypothetical protein
MYALFGKSRPQGNGKIRYKLQEPASLFGCNNGFIPWLLQLKTPQGQGEPYLWHISIETALAETDDYKGSTLVIDLKPRQHKTSLNLFELLDVWGYSSSGWTPILLHLAGLFVDADPKTADPDDFTVSESEIDGPIYETLYLDGSVQKGKIVGTWNAPPASPTNAALLWPDTLNYFIQCIRKRTPEALDFEKVCFEQGGIK